MSASMNERVSALVFERVRAFVGVCGQGQREPP